MDKLYTVREVAEYIKVSTMTIYTLIKEKKLKSVKLGGNVRVKESDLKEFIERG